MFGVFHPLIVHLPIGILLLGALFAVLGRRKAYSDLLVALPTILLLGALSAWASCITGWLLAGSGDYDSATLGPHRWMGIATAFISTLLLLLKKHQQWPLWILLGCTLIITGHLGGTLTHGEGFLWSDDTDNKDKAHAYKGPIDNAQVYVDLIQPILSEKCISCHGEKKKKGGLRLDSPEWIRKGGKSGVAIVPGHAGDSELFNRLLLPVSDDDHMPPQGKPQLGAAQIALIEAWINQGLVFEGRVADMPEADVFRQVMAQGEKASAHIPALPETPVKPADPELIKALQQEGIVILPVFAGSPYLSVSFQGLPTAGDSLVSRLEPLAPQIVWLKLGGTRITDVSLKTIARLSALRRLSLEHTAISDIGPLAGLKNLQYLNLTDTPTSKTHHYLADLPALQQVFLFESHLSPQAYERLKKAHPQMQIDTGAYQVRTLPGDTSVLVRKK